MDTSLSQPLRFALAGVAALIAWGASSLGGAPEPVPTRAYLRCPQSEGFLLGKKLPSAHRAPQEGLVEDTEANRRYADGMVLERQGCQDGWLTGAALRTAESLSRISEGFEAFPAQLRNTRPGDRVQIWRGETMLVDGVRVVQVDEHFLPTDRLGRPLVFSGPTSAVLEVPRQAFDDLVRCQELGPLRFLPSRASWQPGDPTASCAVPTPPPLPEPGAEKPRRPPLTFVDL